eukprot:12057520-Prorocentrum_lima.AAC.1
MVGRILLLVGYGNKTWLCIGTGTKSDYASAHMCCGERRFHISLLKCVVATERGGTGYPNHF